MDFWDYLYNLLGITDFIYFISSPELQDYLFPVKIIFVAFSAFFFGGVVYFMINSSWLQYKFLEDVVEFFSWQSYGAREITKHWDKIKRRLDSGIESEYKLAIIEADDFFRAILDEAGYESENFEEAIKNASTLLGRSTNEILSAHETRNSVVYNPEFKISQDQAKRILEVYESAVNTIGAQ